MQWHTPIGYKIQDGKIIISEEFAPLVKRIFDEYENGKSAIKIAAELKEQGVLNIHGRVAWSHSSIGRILENHNYFGTEYYPRLISDEQFQRVQERREQARKDKSCGKYRPNGRERILFGGVIVCGKCGEVYSHIKPKNRKTRVGEAKWKCRKYVYHNRISCAGGFITDQEVMDVCVRAINQIIESPRLITRVEEPQESISKEFREADRQVQSIAQEQAENRMKLLYKRALARYSTLEVRDTAQRTEEMLTILAGRNKVEVFDEELYRSLIVKIEVNKDSTVKVIFYNRASITLEYGKEKHTRKGENNGSKNSEESVDDSAQTAI